MKQKFNPLKQQVLLIALFFSFLFSTKIVNAQTNKSDSTALVAIYQATGGTLWTASDNWLVGPVETWFGVSVQSGRVTGLFLSSNNLTGKFQAGTLPLTNLFLDNNLLTAIDALPATLENLDFSNNQVASLPSSLPRPLQTLNGSSNKLSFLPSLPASLISLNVNSNLLNFLPALSASLVSLNCTNNRLVTLPTLPANLGGLDCSNNKLIRLPALPSVLETLTATNNKLTALPALPARLSFINVSFNSLSSLPTLPSTSLFINCSNNRLDFGDLEPIIGRFSSARLYAPQAEVGPTSTVTAFAGGTVTLSADYAGSTSNLKYVWLKDSLKISDTLRVPSLKIAKVKTTDAGVYTTNITSTIVKGLTLVRRPITVKVVGKTTSSVSDVTVYPNPFVSSVKVTQPSGWATTAQLVVRNKQSQVVFQKDNYAFGDEVELNDTTPGAYFLTVSDGTQKKTIQLQK